MSDAMMASADQEAIRLVQANRDAHNQVIPTRKGFMRLPEIPEEEPAATIPMDEDQQLERMVNANTAWYRQQEEMVREEERIRLRRSREQDLAVTTRWLWLRRITMAMAPGLLGVAVLGGMARDWMDPLFAAAVAMICFVWAVARVKGCNNGSC